MKRGSLAKYHDTMYAFIRMSDDELSDDLVGHLKCGDVMIVLNKVINSTHCVYYHVVTRCGVGYIRTSYALERIS